MNKELLKQEIQQAWSHVLPLFEKEINPDKTGEHLECIQVAKFFAGKEWTQVTWAVLKTYEGDPSACLNFMTAAGFKYFLPCYMLLGIDNDLDSDVTVDTAWKSLVPSTASYWCQRVAGLSDKQKKVVLNFLNYIQETRADDCYPSSDLSNAIKFWQNG